MTWQNQQCGCAPSEDSDQPGHPPSLIRVFAVRMKKAWVLSYQLSAERRLWSAQADLSLCWAHTHFVGFVMSFSFVVLCGGTFNATTSPQAIISPNYPYPAGQNLRCRWTIDAPENQQLEIVVTAINLQQSPGCSPEYLEMRDYPLVSCIVLSLNFSLTWTHLQEFMKTLILYISYMSCLIKCLYLNLCLFINAVHKLHELFN